MTRSTPLLAALVSPRPVADFLRTHWPDRACAVHGDPQRLPAVLRAPELRSVQALAAKYRGRLTFGNATTSSRTVGIENADAALLLRMGLSLYLPDIVEIMPALNGFLRQFERELGAPEGTARIGAFAASPGNGVTCHYDAEEVFSIQLQGEKRFHIAKAPDIEQPWGIQFNPGDPCFDDLYPQVAAGFPDPQRCAFETVDMKPGTVLFMPRGTWHHTESGEGSLSVSIIVRTPAAFECALEALRLRLLQDARWRRPLYGAWVDGPGREAARQQWQTLTRDWTRVTAGMELDEVLRTWASEDERLERIEPSSRLQRRPQGRMRFEAKAGGDMRVEVVVRGDDGGEQTPLLLEVPAAMVPVFRWLADHPAAFTVAELAARFLDLPLKQHLGIVGALARAGYLHPLWFGVLAGGDGEA